MGAIRDLHAAQNSKSKDCWEAFSSHRQRVTDLVLSAASQLSMAGQDGLSLAVLGAGNGNDLAIEPLLQRFEAIHLFDFDADAMRRNQSRYADRPEVLQRAQWFDSVDLTGVIETMEEPQLAASAITGDLLQRARHPSANFAGQHYDLVLSTCTLSQLIQSAAEAFGDASPAARTFLLAIRDGHLDLMLRLIKTPGIAILVSDFVSSETLPGILQPGLTEERLISIAQTALREQNFFSGVNPLALRNQLETMLQTANASFSLNLSPPWVWKWPGDKAFCVAAIQVVRSK